MSDTRIAFRPYVIGSVNTSFVVPAAAAYTGPGDVVSSAFGFWGLRAYNAAYATGSNPCMIIVNTADGTGDTTINIKSNGYVDDAAVQTAISGGGWSGASIKQLHDHTINARHLTQATLANMPIYNATGGPNSYPSIQFTAANSQNLLKTGLSITTPFSLIGVSDATATTGANRYILSVAQGATTATGINHRAAANNIGMGPEAIVAANDGVFHAVQGARNTASDTSYISVDGTATSGAVTLLTFDQIGFGFQAQTSNQFMQGFISEAGLWSVDFNAGGNFTAMNANMHAAYGGW